MDDYQYGGPTTKGHEVRICLRNTTFNRNAYPDIQPGQTGKLGSFIGGGLFNVKMGKKTIMASLYEIGEIGDPEFDEMVAETSISFVIGE
jgi:hypothetical protein